MVGSIMSLISFIILLFSSCVLADSDITEINNTFQLLNEGEEKIILDHYKNVTLVIGNTGTGKTTLTQWIAGYDNKLTAKEITQNTGEFIIVDGDGDRIGNSTINSQTTFPELVVDNETNTAFYDCPGFSDTRSVSYDIAGTYFLKKLTDHADGFKIILVVSYHSVREGVDRLNFMILMKHAMDFIKDVDKFRESLALIVTKVDNQVIKKQNEGLVLVSDENIIKNIAQFLLNVKQTLEVRLGEDEYHKEKQFYKNVVKLLDILLLKNDDRYIRIGLFRRPNEPGPLNEIPLLQNGKKFIAEMIRNRLDFTVKNIDSFGYTVSEKSKNKIHSLIDTININIRSNATEIASEIQQYCGDLLDRVNKEVEIFTESVSPLKSDLPSQVRKVSTIMSVLPNLFKETESSCDVEQSSERINSTVNQIEIKCPTCYHKIKNLALQGRYYNFLQTVYGSKLPPSDWESRFQILEYCLDKTKKTKQNIRDKRETADQSIKNREIKHLTEKEIEENYLKKLNETEIEDLSRMASEFANDTLFLAKHRKSLKLLKILSGRKSETDTIKWTEQLLNIAKRLNVSQEWYAYLQHERNELSKFETQKNRSEYNSHWIQINRNNIKSYTNSSKDLNVTDERLKEINHVMDLALSHKIYKECFDSGKLVIKGNFIKMSDIIDDFGNIRNPCNVSLKSVEIFALNMIIIDRDFNGLGSRLKLSIIAPKWVVQGTRKINLDGLPGKLIQSPKAVDGFNVGENGANGKPGFPGGPAGHFLGIANEITNGSSLKITAKGGPGSAGQRGGNAANGKDGEHAEANKLFKSEKIGGEDLWTFFFNKDNVQYVYYGKNGSKGGDGGNGGAGGLGGENGQINMLILLNSSTLPSTESSPGARGPKGKGGSKGEGGIQGNDKLVWYCNSWLFAVIPIEDENICGQNDNKTQRIRAMDGLNGKDGLNSDGIIAPEKPQLFQNVPSILNQYKYYLREAMVDRFQSRSLKQFLHQLETSQKIEETYDTVAFTNEFLALVKQIDRLQGLTKNDIIYFYQLLLNRTEERAKHVQNIQHRKILSTLYAAALSRVYNLKSDSKQNLIINTELNLDLLTNDIISLKNLDQKTKKTAIINRYKAEFKTKITKQIQEAESIINNQIIPQINEIHLRIGKQTELLTNEISALHEEAEKNKTTLIQKKQALVETLTKNYVFDYIKFFGKLVLSLFQLGSVVEMATDATNLIGEGLRSNVGRDFGGPIMPDETVHNIRLLNDEVIDKEFDALPIKSTRGAKKIKAVDDAIKKANHNIERFKRYEAKLYKKLKPVLANITEDINHIVSHRNSTSKAFYEVSKWQVPKALREMKLQMRRMAEELSVEEDIAGSIESLEEIVTTLINIYDQIQNYQYQKELADYMADISSPIDISDQTLSKAENELEIYIRSNLVLKHYQIAIDALKQHTFPLVHLYLDEQLLPSDLKLEDNFENLVNTTAKQIETVQRKIKDYKLSITNQDKYINCGWFNSEYKSAEPFFTWENQKHRSTITDLLSGKKVIIKADILVGHFDKDAIKFNMVGINFRSNDSSVTSAIKNKLQRFTVKATHTGNSYYRFKNNIYVITTSSQNIVYSFEKDAQGNPVRKNNVYDKIKSGDLMLSPYTMWEFQLVSPGSNFGLQMYKDKVDLELIGHGCYLDKDYDIPIESIKKYYKEDDHLSAIIYDNELT